MYGDDNKNEVSLSFNLGNILLILLIISLFIGPVKNFYAWKTFQLYDYLINQSIEHVQNRIAK